MLDLTLSRRAVAAGWKWQKGATAVGFGVVSYHRPADEWSPERVCTADNEHVNDWENTENMLPDFNDAATRGVLIQQVRERWDDPWLCVAWTGVIWICVDRHGIGLVPPCRGDSETAALVAALEAAPKEKAL